MSKALRKLILALVHPDATKRLGAAGITALRQHDYFEDVEWGLLERRLLRAPWRPSRSLVYANDEVAPLSAAAADTTEVDGARWAAQRQDWEFVCSGAGFEEELAELVACASTQTLLRWLDSPSDAPAATSSVATAAAAAAAAATSDAPAARKGFSSRMLSSLHSAATSSATPSAPTCPALVPGALLVAAEAAPSGGSAPSGSDFFSAAVVLLLSVSRERDALGVVLNHLGAANSDASRLGGPIDQGRTSTLHSLDNVRGARRVCDGVSVGGEVPADSAADSVRRLAGVVEWEARQLDREVHRGVWRVLSPAHARHCVQHLDPLSCWSLARELL